MACSSLTLGGLGLNCDALIGGIRTVYVANFDDVSALTETSGKITGITMVTSKKFKEYKFAKATGSLTSNRELNADTGASMVTSDLILRFAKYGDTAVRLEMEALSLNELVIIVKDLNGRYILIGRKNPVTLGSGTGQTGTATTDGNYYELTLQDEDTAWPYEVDGTVITSDIIDFAS